MRVQQINSVQTFRGIYGPSRTSTYDDSTYHCEDTTINYYPFKDESKEEIDAVELKSTSSGPNSSKYAPSPITNYNSTTYKISERLPFTKMEYDTYIKNPGEMGLSQRLSIRTILDEIAREAISE